MAPLKVSRRFAVYVHARIVQLCNWPSIMKSGITLFALLFAILLVQGYARTDSLSQGIYEGTVEALFEEAHPGVYLARRAETDAKVPTWVHIRFDAPLSDGRRFAVAVLPPQLAVKAGDRVEMRFGDAADIDAQGPERNVVTRVLAPASERLAHAR
jgi:hypothetical protein